MRMNDLPERLFANPVWHALRSTHQKFAKCARDACRYPARVVPLAAIRAPGSEPMLQLRSLFEAGESAWIVGAEYVEVPGLVRAETLECLQMVLPDDVRVPDTQIEIVKLSEGNADEMVALTTLSFPGFFRQKTCEMGSYYGVRSASGELIAMGGERLKLDGFTEISAVCTHPSFRGRGLAAAIIWQVVREHRQEGVVSWLHVASANRRAEELYLRMGFNEIRRVTLHRVSRVG
jgi:predicted GNAT family acetyltransferase